MNNARQHIYTNDSKDQKKHYQSLPIKRPLEIGVVIASHNRRDQTLISLDRLHESAMLASCKISVVLFDDGSNDGTAAAVSTKFPGVQILHGDGSNFWARSMSVAEETLRLTNKSIDYIMWLNDDVLLDRNSIIRLIEASDRNPAGIIVGATREPATNTTSYSGLRSHKIRPLMFDMVLPADTDIPVDAFNGNCVFMPKRTANAMGRIDGHFSHALADVEYGLRANHNHIPVLLAPHTFGSCPRNPPASWKGLKGEWESFVGAKGGGNIASLKRILHKLRPRTWFIHMAASYTLWATKSIYKACFRKRVASADKRAL